MDKIHEGEKYKAKNIEEYLEKIKGEMYSRKYQREQEKNIP